MSKFQNFTKEDIDAMAAMDFDSAKAFGHELITKAETSEAPIKADKCRYLHGSVDRARNTMDLLGLFYNMLLSGEGLGSVDSRYSKKFA